MAREGESDFSQREIDKTLALLIDTKAWILRRIDRVHLVDTYTIRRTIHFEIELPDWALEAARQDDCRLILPLAVFGGGQALRNLEVTVGQDPAGTLTRHAGDTLTRLMSERLKKNGDLGIPRATRDFMALLLGTDGDPTVDETNEQPEGDVRAPAAGRRRKDNYILFVTSDKSISNSEAAGSRFVIEVKTDQTIVNGLRNPDQQPNAIAKTLTALGLGRVSRLTRGRYAKDEDRGHRFRFLAWWTRWKRKLWPTDTAFILAQSISGFGDARSWQLEVYAPTELRVTDGALLWWPLKEGSSRTEAKRSARPTRRANSAVALTRFRVQADGVLDLGILIGLSSLALLSLAIVIGAVGRSAAIIDAIVAVLVIAPSLGASIVTNPENHEMAGQYLRPYRRIIYLIGVVSAIGAAFFIFVGLAENALQSGGEKKFFLIFESLDDMTLFPPNEALAAVFFLVAMVLTWGVLLFLIKELLWIRSDLDERSRKSEKLFAIDGQDIDLRPFVESTCFDRPYKGWRGSIWKKSADFREERKADSENPFLSLSIDAIDIGPRAIFRLPARTDLVPEYEVEAEGDGAGRKWLAARTDDAPYGNPDSHIREGLFERFFGNVWFEDRPPDWFYWTSDIEADYTENFDFPSDLVERWKEERVERQKLDGERVGDGGTEAPGRGMAH